MLLQRFLVRLLTMLITLFGVAVVVFVVIRVAPGDPIAMMLPPGATNDDIARLRALYGLDKTIVQQFFIWLSGVARGDFGTSISLRQDVLGLVFNRLPATLELAIVALVMAVAIGGTTAILGARERGTAVEAGIDIASGAALSIPDFLWGLVLILLFGVLVPIFDISGRVSPQLDLPFVTQFYFFESLLRLRFDLTWDLLKHLLMPAVALALPLAAIISQLLKQSLKEMLDLDYVVLARVKGFSETQVILREALKNAALPTLTLIGVQFTFLIGGTVIVERLFSYEGLGNMAIDAVINRDLPLIQGIVLVFALLFVLINLTVDMMYALLIRGCAMDEARISRRGLSPRLRLAGGWLLLALLAAIFAPLIAPQDPLAQDLMLERLPPFWLDGAEPGYWLGTDSLGRDLLSRLIFGGRIAFIVAFAAAIAACVVGSTLGLIAGYFGGWADRIISRIVDIWMAFPPVLFAILLVAVLGTGLSSVILAIAIIDWTRFCRVIRAEAMGQSRMDYVENARIAGYGRIGIMLREVLPNVVPSIVALLSLEMGIAVIVEAILSFVNLSISTDDPTWGGIIAEGRLSIHQAWWVLVFPLITLILTVLSFSQFGEALKTRFDPVLR